MVPAPETMTPAPAPRHGDQPSFGRLFDREYAGMRAVADRMLGPGPDAEDACQDAAVIALTRRADLWDPAKAGPWLQAVVRDRCRAVLRARRPVLVGLAGADLLATERDDPVAQFERLAEREWVWHGLRRLTPAVLPVALLRYFTARNSYAEIAAQCGIPVGTVRSRLNEARRQLAAVLPVVRDDRHARPGARVVRDADGRLREVRLTDLRDSPRPRDRCRGGPRNEGAGDGPRPPI